MIEHAAALAVSSTAWMLASTQWAGFVSWAPVDVSVIVTSQRSRPSCERPYVSSVDEARAPPPPPRGATPPVRRSGGSDRTRTPCAGWYVHPPPLVPGSGRDPVAPAGRDAVLRPARCLARRDRSSARSQAPPPASPAPTLRTLDAMSLALTEHPSFPGRPGPVLLVIADGVGVAPARPEQRRHRGRHADARPRCIAWRAVHASSLRTARRSACRPTTTWATARSATTRSAPAVSSRRGRSSSTRRSPTARSSQSPVWQQRHRARPRRHACTSSDCTPTAACTRTTSTSTRCSQRRRRTGVTQRDGAHPPRRTRRAGPLRARLHRPHRGGARRDQRRRPRPALPDRLGWRPDDDHDGPLRRRLGDGRARLPLPHPRRRPAVPLGHRGGRRRCTPSPTRRVATSATSTSASSSSSTTTGVPVGTVADGDAVDPLQLPRRPGDRDLAGLRGARLRRVRPRRPDGRRGADACTSPGCSSTTATRSSRSSTSSSRPRSTAR